MGRLNCVNIKRTTFANSFYYIGFDIPVFRMLFQHKDSLYLEVSKQGRYTILGSIILSTIAARRAQLHNHELHSCTTDCAFQRTTAI